MCKLSRAAVSLFLGAWNLDFVASVLLLDMEFTIVIGKSARILPEISAGPGLTIAESSFISMSVCLC
jgi:hypothetical protein